MKCQESEPEDPEVDQTEENVSSARETDFHKIQNGDFVLANFFGKRKSYKYVCLIIEVSDDEAEVTCLRKMRKPEKFRLEEKDKCSILLSDIIQKLERPKLVPYGDNQKYIFSSAVDVSEQ
ncbi:unnamed protein product [Ceutorhynchus assimilis]|uniref:Uncharacterized protein n=1 Tax=Ceutorhynchus assimilis TaxID=467358 RepID=A0A9N9MCY3_9CUCU|nr:unnamed protein product [Ceutorhynchus assimilis]